MTQHQSKLHPAIIPLMGTAGGIIANIYYNQPILKDIGDSIHVTETAIGKIAMLSQLGFRFGLFFLLPLGDKLNDSLGLDVPSDQLPVIIRKSKEAKKGVYLGKGVNRWSNVHIADLANLYFLALEKAKNASSFYAENGEESYKDLAVYISKALGFGGETVSWEASQALTELGDWARYALGSNSRVRGIKARKDLCWGPTQLSVSEWIASKKDSLLLK